MTDFTRKQGETLKITFALKDASGYPIKIATDTVTPLMYFAGVADLNDTEEAILFKYGPVETKTTGLGDGEVTETGIFTVICYISADSTATMTTGAWDYTIRVSETVNPADTDNVRIMLEGILTINASLATITSATTYVTPSA